MMETGYNSSSSLPLSLIGACVASLPPASQPILDSCRSNQVNRFDNSDASLDTSWGVWMWVSRELRLELSIVCVSCYDRSGRLQRWYVVLSCVLSVRGAEDSQNYRRSQEITHEISITSTRAILNRYNKASKSLMIRTDSYAITYFFLELDSATGPTINPKMTQQ